MEGYFVMLVDQGHQVWRSDLKVLYQDNNVAVIGDGLEVGDQVITANQDQYQDRQKLAPGQLDSSDR